MILRYLADVQVAGQPVSDDALSGGDVLDERHGRAQISQVPRPSAVIEVDDRDPAARLDWIDHQISQPQVGVDQTEPVRATTKLGQPGGDLIGCPLNPEPVLVGQPGRQPPVPPPRLRAEDGIQVPPKSRESRRWGPLARVVVHDRGDAAELIEPDAVGILLCGASRDETHRVDMQYVAIHLGGHHVATVSGIDHFRCDDLCLSAQRLHPGQFRTDRGQRVIARPVHPKHHRLAVFNQVGGVLRQAQ